jgi:hypothetical protein
MLGSSIEHFSSRLKGIQPGSEELGATGQNRKENEKFLKGKRL